MSKKPPKKRALGRPSTYTEAKGRAICKLLAEGMTLRRVCVRLELKQSTVRGWVLDIDTFAAQYARAREMGYQAMADELVDISDDNAKDWKTIGREGAEYDVPDREVVDRSRLRVDTRKWLLSKALPKIYGDRLDVSAKHEAGDSFKAMWAALASGGIPA